MGTALFLHLLVVPDYVAYSNAVSFPFNNIHATLYQEEGGSGGPFVFNGTTSCNSVSSCLLQICVSPIAINSDNYLCLQTSKPTNMMGPPSLATCEPTQPYTWLFVFYMFLFFLEAVALAVWFWIYRSQYATRVSFYVTSELATKFMFIMVGVMFGLSLIASMVLMVGAGDSAVAVLVMLLVRCTGAALVGQSMWLNWLNEVHQQGVVASVEPYIYSETQQKDDLSVDSD